MGRFTKRGMQTWLKSSLLSFSEEAPQLATCRDSILLPTSKAMSKELQPSCSEKARLHVVAGPLTKSKGCTYMFDTEMSNYVTDRFPGLQQSDWRSRKKTTKMSAPMVLHIMARPFPIFFLFLLGPGSDSHKLTKLTPSNRCQLVFHFARCDSHT